MQNKRLDAILQSFVASGDDTRNKLLGAAFVVVNKDGVIYQGSAGRTDLPLDSPPFTVDSFTWIASMTKIITATAIMQAVERGILDLDQDVRPLVSQLSQMEILRGFETDPDAGTDRPLLEPNTKPITLRQLLTHTVGLGYDIADQDLNRWSSAVGRTVTNLDYTLEGWTTPLKFAPGEGWLYGSAVDWAAQVLVAALERSGKNQSFSNVLASNILSPLGMHDTTFFSLKADERLQSRKVVCSFRDAETGTLTIGPLPVPTNPPTESGGAGLWSTCADHVRLLRALLVRTSDLSDRTNRSQAAANSGSNPDALLLRPETVAEMFRPQLDEKQRQMLESLADKSHDSMAPAFEAGMPLDHGITGTINLEDAPGKRRAGSMAWMGMAGGHWWIDPKTGIAASLFVNVMPIPDPAVIKLYDQLERAVYQDLVG